MAVAIIGALALFMISFAIGEDFFESHHIDKALHIGTGIMLALFFSVFLDGYDVSLFMAVLAVGMFWEFFQYYRDINDSIVNIFNHKDFLLDALGDIFGDMIGVVFYFWWVRPNLN